MQLVIFWIVMSAISALVIGFAVYVAQRLAQRPIKKEVAVVNSEAKVVDQPIEITLIVHLKNYGSIVFTKQIIKSKYKGTIKSFYDIFRWYMDRKSYYYYAATDTGGIILNRAEILTIEIKKK
jgi:hypothetical protein